MLEDMISYLLRIFASFFLYQCLIATNIFTPMVQSYTINPDPSTSGENLEQFLSGLYSELMEDTVRPIFTSGASKCSLWGA